MDLIQVFKLQTILAATQKRKYQGLLIHFYKYALSLQQPKKVFFCHSLFLIQKSKYFYFLPVS